MGLNCYIKRKAQAVENLPPHQALRYLYGWWSKPPPRLQFLLSSHYFISTAINAEECGQDKQVTAKLFLAAVMSRVLYLQRPQCFPFWFWGEFFLPFIEHVFWNPSRLYMEAVQDAAFSWCIIPSTWASVKDESSYQYESMKGYSHHFWLFQV